jgi:hypothetical protein
MLRDPAVHLPKEVSPMNKLFLALAPALLASCAATSNPLVVSSDYAADASDVYTRLDDTAPVATDLNTGFDAGTTFSADAASMAATVPARTPYMSLDDDAGLRENRFVLKGGLYDSDDISELDDGWIITASWMKFFTSLLALELELGYFTSDGSSGGISADLWGIPIFVNGRVNLPVWVIDLYAGLGLGTIYYDVEVGTADDDGFIWAGQAFLGGSVNIADAIALGLEVKYIVTDDVSSSVDSNLDAVAFLLTLGFAR